MSPEFKKLYSIANNLANLMKTEYGNVFIGISKIINVIKSDHLAELLLSKVNSTPERIKVCVMTYFILNRKMEPAAMEGIIMNLYVAIIELYEDTEVIKNECDYCYGSGDEQCDHCDGSGRQECRSCDGETTIDCDSCDGSGNEECRYCDGRGSETDTEEDDDGDEVEVEVECVHCDGTGEDRCSDCGGTGNFECPSCEGAGDEECGWCDGYGSSTCSNCDGTGEVETNDYRYNIRKSFNIMIGDGFSQYEGEYFSVEDFNEIESNEEIVPFNLEIYVKYIEDDEMTAEDRRDSVGMEDNFVEVSEVIKLDDLRLNVGF